MRTKFLGSLSLMGCMLSIPSQAQVLSYQSVQTLFSQTLSADNKGKDFQVLRRPAGPLNGPEQNSLNQGYLKLPDGWIYSLFPAVKRGNGKSQFHCPPADTMITRFKQAGLISKDAPPKSDGLQITDQFANLHKDKENLPSLLEPDYFYRSRAEMKRGWVKEISLKRSSYPVNAGGLVSFSKKMYCLVPAENLEMRNHPRVSKSGRFKDITPKVSSTEDLVRKSQVHQSRATVR